MESKVTVNVWVYTSMLDDFLEGKCEGELYPLEPRYQTQLLVPYDKISFKSETDGTCKLIEAKVVKEYTESQYAELLQENEKLKEKIQWLYTTYADM